MEDVRKSSVRFKGPLAYSTARDICLHNLQYSIRVANLDSSDMDD